MTLSVVYVVYLGGKCLKYIEVRQKLKILIFCNSLITYLHYGFKEVVQGYIDIGFTPFSGLCHFWSLVLNFYKKELRYILSRF